MYGSWLKLARTDAGEFIYCGVYDVEGTGHLKSDSSVIGDSKVADIIFVSLTALKYHYVMLLFTSPDNINI